MSDDQFSKLFKYMQEMRAEMNARFDDNAKEHADIRRAVAELGAQIRDYHQEMMMLARKLTAWSAGFMKSPPRQA